RERHVPRVHAYGGELELACFFAQVVNLLGCGFRLEQRVINQRCDFVRSHPSPRRIFRHIQNADIFQIAIPFAVVQSVTDHEFVGNRKPDVIGFDVLNAPRRLIEERRDFERLRLAFKQNAAKIAERQAGVENVFNENYVQTGDIAVEILVQADLAGGFLVFSVAGDGHEIDGSVEFNFADEVSEKNAGAFEHAD